jgi:pyruvate,water dikinase
MSKAGGLVSQDGGLTCHTEIVAREMNKPCLVGVKNVLRVLKDNDKIELDSEGGKIKIL